ncbi:PulJ/GspJ family protein [Alteromonas facilis]|uniref:PulJ/GspJ family protein n=1 Tax=Alteromonas facilis TaxID=2048004 RepID=UPI000C282637|nr:prepilin-type N-terminal cleavage/methylation domain-containing protein [Alteromonas facilis]
MTSKKGFTLVELMISMTILSAMLMTGSYIYLLLSSKWEYETKEYDCAIDKMKSLAIIQRQLHLIAPHIVEHEQNGELKPVFFFIGNEKSLLSINSQGLFDATSSEVFRINATQQEDGRFEVVYQAVSMPMLELTSTDQELVFDRSIVLFDDLSEFNISYYGFETYDQQGEASDYDSEISPSWTAVFDGTERQIMPFEINISVIDESGLADYRLKLDEKSVRYMTNAIESRTEL